MKRILVIEKSDTRRHVINRLLTAHGFDALTYRDFSSAVSLVHALNSTATEKIGGVIFGWPDYTDPYADDFLEILISAEWSNTPVLIMADKYDSAKRDWVTGRSRAAMLSWHDYSDIYESFTTLLNPQQDHESAHAKTDSSAHAGDRILFVDDSPTIRASYRRLLKDHAYTVDTANSVEEALDKLRDHNYDIVITDYFMPAANGDQLCAAIREDPKLEHIAVAIITGTYLDRVIKASLDAGATECMFKNEADELFLARVDAMSRTVKFQKSIEDDRRRLSGILSSVGEGVYGVDTKGMITFINPTARRILGWSGSKDLIGKSAHATFHYAQKDGRPIPAETCFLQRAYRDGGEMHDVETVFWHASGTPVVVECSAVPLRTNGVLEGSVIAFGDITQRKMLEEELVWQANHDSLTKLHNRLYFEKQLEAEVMMLKRSESLSALLYIDLDRFKYINDTAGHSAGDRLLVDVSKLLQTRIRETDVLARVGGDEFAAIMRNVQLSDVETISQSFHELLHDNPYLHEGKSHQIDCSIGVAWLDRTTHTAEEALANADLACNIAKRHGRNQTHVYSPESDEKVAMGLDLGWSVRLREALQKNLFTVHYQPIVSLSDIDMAHLPAEDGQLWEHIARSLPHLQQHFEVLIRLRGPDGEIISPSAFLPTAERFNMMRDLDRWVIAHALRDLKRVNRHRADTVFAINLSGLSVGDETLLPAIKQLLVENRVDPRSIIFEITETAAIENLDEARLFIRELSGLGCRFALDDFGSGFSSFTHLKHLNVDFIKIDGNFIQGVAQNSVDRSIVTSINDVAHALGKRTIAEYVQSAEVLRALQECGVDYVQGFYISRPHETVGENRRESGDNVIPFSALQR